MQSLSLDPKSVQTVVRSLYRLTRVAGVHALDNDAVNLAIDSVLSAVRSLDGFERAGLTFIVAEGTVIVNGQLLRAPPDVYDDAIGLAKTLEPAGANALTLGPGVDAPSLRALLDHFSSSAAGRTRLPRDGHLTPHIRLRHVNAERLLGLEDERLGPVERALLTYALTALILRQLFDRARGGELEITSSFKRLTRQLALVDYTAHPTVLDVILGEMDKDATHRAIDTAILSAAAYRRVTDDPGALGRIVLASILLDLRHGGLDDAPLASALAHVDLGRLRGDTVDRVLVSYEANALLSGAEPSTIHPDGGAPSLEAYILATSRQFLDARVALANTGDCVFDGVLALLHEQAPDDLAHLCVDLLVEAIGLIPQGTAVELESGHRGLVLRAGASPSLFDSPLVRIYEDPRGARVEPFEVACGEAVKARDVGRVVRVLHRPSPLIAAAQQAMGGVLVDWARARKDAESRVRSWLESDLHGDDDAGPEPRPSATGSQLGVDVDDSAPEVADAPPGRRDARSSSRSGALPAVSGALSRASGAFASVSGGHTSISGALPAVGEGAVVGLPPSPAAAEFNQRAQRRPPPKSDASFSTSGASLPARDVSGSSPAPRAAAIMREPGAPTAAGIVRRPASMSGGHTALRDSGPRRSIKEHLEAVREREEGDDTES